MLTPGACACVPLRFPGMVIGVGIKVGPLVWSLLPELRVAAAAVAVALAAAAVAAAAAESAFTKLVIRLLLSWGWVGVSMDLGGMLPVRTLRSCVGRVQVGHIGLGGAESRLA